MAGQRLGNLFPWDSREGNAFLNGFKAKGRATSATQNRIDINQSLKYDLQK